jgi:rubredoxin
MIEEINGRWTCTECEYEWSAMLGDNEIPDTCSCMEGNDDELLE